MDQYGRLQPLGTDFRMTNMLRELSDCIRTMPNATNGDHLHILTIEKKMRTQTVIAKYRTKGRNILCFDRRIPISRDSELI